nr:MAG TPA: hypothetical protein [Caudoviricetes sp.]
MLGFVLLPRCWFVVSIKFYPRCNFYTSNIILS